MELNLRAVDLNLLPVFEAVYEERSTSRAARRLAMTQPAVSHALTRLRALFRDELFLREAHGMRATAAAEHLHAHLASPLTAVREVVGATRTFDPATARRTLAVAIAHPMGPLMALTLRKRLSRSAPGVRVEFSTRSRPVDLARDLAEGRIDAAVDWLLPAGRRFAESVAFDDALVVMARAGHAVLRQRTVAAAVAACPGLVTLRKRIEGEHPIPALREFLKLRFRDTLQVSELIEVLVVARASDFVAPVPLSMQRLAGETFGLRPVTALPRVGPIPIKLLWSAGREHDPALAFLRKELAAAVGEAVHSR